jgi:non-lysosomal glucosylceramidase
VEDNFADYLYLLYDRALDLNVFPEDKARMTLRTVYENNVLKFGNGYMGAVNGIRNGEIIEGEQERESWSGTSYALGATMLAYGMTEEGWMVIYGTENLATNLAGTFGDWPEAITIEPGKNGIPASGIRAKNYLRVLSMVDVLYTENIQ